MSLVKRVIDLPGSIILAGILNQRSIKAMNLSILFLGAISLELYLTNIFLPVMLRKEGVMSLLQTLDRWSYIYSYFQSDICNSKEGE